MGDILVGIDLGTTNLTVAAFDVAGEMVAQASRPTPTYHPRAEWTEHDPDRLWERLCEAMREVVSAVGDADRIAGLAIASMGEAGVPLDREGRARPRQRDCHQGNAHNAQCAVRSAQFPYAQCAVRSFFH